MLYTYHRFSFWESVNACSMQLKTKDHQDPPHGKIIRFLHYNSTTSLRITGNTAGFLHNTTAQHVQYSVVR